MSLSLIYGAPHSGRTERLYDQLIREAKAHPDRQYIMLVPEQASLTVQEELVVRHPDHALSNVDVLTFQRLAHRVFKETGTETKDIIDDEGKLLFLQLAVNRNRDRLLELRKCAGKIGMLMALKSVFSEFAEYNVTPELLKEKTALISDNKKLKNKLDDLAVLYEDFLDLVHTRFTLVEERMSVLGRAIRKWSSAPEVTIVMDGFTGFTPPQYEVISAMLSSCREVVLALTVGTDYCEEKERDPEDLFYMPTHAAEKIRELAIRAGQEIREETVRGTDERPEALRFLEKELFSLSSNTYAQAADAVRIVRGRTIREEITFVIREIKKSLREGLRLRDLAIVTGDMKTYREELEERLKEADLPFFIDANKPLDHSPLIRLLSDAIFVCRSGFGFDAVFSFVKNPLAVNYGGAVTAFDRIAEVENFALARGFRSRNGYAKTWEGGYNGFNPARLEAVNETKSAILQPLIEYYDRMTGGKPTVKDRVRASKALIGAYSVEDALKKTAEVYEQETGEPIGKEYEAVRTFVIAYLDRMEDIIGELTLSVEEFEDLVNAGLRRAELGLVPPTKDQLIVGNLMRTRLAHIRKLFVMGANEGKLPEIPDGNGLLNDRDREALKDVELTLSETAEENTFNSRYYLYLLLNEPAESLVISYAGAENDGTALHPAKIVGTLLHAFPENRTEDGAEGYFPEVFSDTSGLYALSGALRAYRIGELSAGRLSADEKAKALYQWFRNGKGYENALRQIDEGLFYHYQKEILPEDVAKKLFGDVIYGSVSRLESFAECPYRHFLNYGLEIRERTVYQLAAADLGSIAHESIERFFSLVEESGREWEEITDEEQEALISRSVEEVTAEYGNAILSDSARNVFLAERIRRIMVRTLWALSRQWSAGGFKSTESELKFRTDEDRELLELSSEEGLKLALTGRIDRIDVAEDGDAVFVKVIDYKSGRHELDYTKIYHGLQLQLLLYMQVALKREKLRHPEKKIVPAGIYYYTVEDPLIQDATRETVQGDLLKKLRMNGLTNEDPEAIDKIDRTVKEGLNSVVVSGLSMKNGEADGAVLSEENLEKLGAFSVKKAEELAREISQGVIEAAPYRYEGNYGCKYCDYYSICGQDRRLRTMDPRELEEKTLEAIVSNGSDESAE